MTSATMDSAASGHAGKISSAAQSGNTASVRYARRFALPFVLLALFLSAASFVILLGLTRIEPDRTTIIVILSINAAFTALMLLLVGREVQALLRARRKGRAAARMHIRIVGLFGVVASIPAILVAIIAGISLDQGLERIFDTRTRTIVDNSISVAESYVRAATDSLNTHTVNMGIFLNRNTTLFDLDRTGFENLLSGQARARGLIGAYVLTADGNRLVGATAPRVDALPNPPREMLEQAADGQPSCILPRRQALAACAFLLKDFPSPTFFYALTAVDPTVLNSIQLMEEATADYARLETGRVPLQVAFAFLYVGLCLTILLAAIWMGIAVADRFVEPIRRLIGAADEVAAGNLDVRVPKTKSEGELRSLTNTFNAMTADLRSQRAEILQTQELIDSRRRFTEAVLAGVSAAVIGVGANGLIAIANSSADEMFGNDGDILDKPLSAVSPELNAVMDAANRSGKTEHREQITLAGEGRERTLNVQVTVERDGTETHSHVLTIDDISDLVVAQRTSAWADVARRIAHEIKNPLTPIQLSAERIRRRYGKVITEDREVFDQCTDTIIRQVEDIGRMVDEFSSFARMPKPQMQVGDLAGPVKEAAFLLRVEQPENPVRRGPWRCTAHGDVRQPFAGAGVRQRHQERDRGHRGIRISGRRKADDHRSCQIQGRNACHRDNR